MNELDLLEAMGGISAEYRRGAFEKPAPAHRRLPVLLGAACLLAAVCTSAFLLRGQQTVQPMTEQSREAEITEITRPGEQTTEFAVLQTETTASSATLSDTAETSTAASSQITGSAGTQAAAQEPAATANPAAVHTAAAVPGTTPPAQTTAAVPAETAPAEPAQRPQYPEALGTYTLPEALERAIAEAIGTDEYCYYLYQELPVSIPWKFDKCAIITKDRFYCILCRPTETSYEVDLVTSGVIPETTVYVSGPKTLEVTDSAGEAVQISLPEAGHWSGWPLSGCKKTDGVTECDCRIVWELIHMQERPDAFVSSVRTSYSESPFSRYTCEHITLNYTPEDFTMSRLNDPIDVRKVSSVSCTEGNVTRELSDEEITDAVEWLNQLEILDAEYRESYNIIYDIIDGTGKYVGIQNSVKFYFNEPISFGIFLGSWGGHVQERYIKELCISKRNDGSFFLQLHIDAPNRSDSNLRWMCYLLHNEDLHIYQQDT
ncbi:MAG: hypothetical protein IJ060_00275 [Oscillospiraceae bacterium]|nr:hypothetical protein [Oscillospiraceae bacterium]